MLFSDSSGRDEYRVVAWLFLRLLALIYLAAFASLGGQITALAGSQGILPFAEVLQQAGAQSGLARYLSYPTLFWIDAGDNALQAVAWVGGVFALLLLFNVLPRLAASGAFVCYLSLFHAAQIFTKFQWDLLLLEAGFLAIFLPTGSRVVVWLYRWLLFRLRFLSGAAKLLSQDPSWAGLTALNYYFETQPLPNAGAWYAHQLPEWVLQFGTGATLFVELVVPFMMFLPRKPRFIAAWLTIVMQLLILAASNHNFFNLLTLILCLFLFDDRALRRVVPAGLARRIVTRIPASGVGARVLMAPLAVALVAASLVQMGEMFAGRRAPEPIAKVMDRIQPLHLTHRYHVFPNMTTERLEIVLEGSWDAQHWRPYRFRYKPDYLDRRPPFVVPHQPRLDWMLWFVPLGHPMNLAWYQRFVQRLLENAAPVTALLEVNPFGERPPHYVRASLYRYRFTDRHARAATGAWWTREYVGPFYPWPWLSRDTPP